MSESLDDLKDVLQVSLKSLENEKEAYILREKQLKTLACHNRDGRGAPSKRLICIGCDLWVEMTPAEADAYFDRRAKANAQDLLQISEKIDRSRTMLNNILQLMEDSAPSQPSEETNEEGLPILDIQEMLDDDGVVVSVKINDEPVAMDKNANSPTTTTNTGEIASNGSKELQETEKIEFIEDFEDAAAIAAETDDNDQIEELLADMEIVSKNAEKDVAQESTHPASEVNRNSDDLPEDSVPAIRPEDIYELELIASEVAPNDEEGDFDVEDFDFDLEDSFDEDGDDDEDDDDDTKADEILYGGNFGMFTGNSPLQDRLWGEIQAIRNKKLEQTPQIKAPSTELKPKLKLVRFKETTEIKEIDNVSESLKNIEHKKQKPLRFRESLISAGKSEYKRDRPSKKIGTDDVTSDVTDRSAIVDKSSSSVPVWNNEVRER